MRISLLLSSLLLLACASAPRPLPDEIQVSPTAVADPIAETVPATRPMLAVIDESNLFRMRATDDEMVLKLVAEYDHAPDSLGRSFEGDEGLVSVEVSARPSEGVSSTKIAAGTFRMAYATNSGWTVSSLRSDMDGGWARFTYSGSRVDCDREEGSACTKMRPVDGMIVVFRIKDHPEYTAIVRAEWHPSLAVSVVPHIDAIVESVTITDR